VKKLLASGAVTALLLPMVVVLAFAAAIANQQSQGGDPSALALADIPPDYLARYQAAAKTCPGMSWALLAAIGKIETDHGRNTSTSSAGAQGPMQFLPSTWAAYGVDGNHDGVKDINNPDDAVYGAANYLCHNGAGDPAHLKDAVYAYNHAQWYVDKVLAQMQAYLDQKQLIGSVGAPTQAAGVAVQAAMAELGKPYQWGACGPSSWDCSCLMQHAYAVAGISIPRTTTSQYSGSGPQVARDQLAPGDLVFFGTASNIHHVGMYVGNGQMVAAPHTGAVVRIESLHADYFGATRPSAGHP
jgi:cell wall-associated NlpC family hydrolase